jgi:hypothetical protein
MKIIVEKINGAPNHSVNKNDIKMLLEIIPKEWIGVAHVFKVSSQMYDNSKWDRYVIQNNTTFNILSRGIEKELVIKDLLIEIALIPNKIYTINRHKISFEQRKKMEEFIQPLFDEFIIKSNFVN